MSIKVTFLGTSSAVPTKERNLSATCVQFPQDQSLILVDCGEGTQHRLQASSLKLSKIHDIFITHLHGDHIFGLVGLLCSMSGCSDAEETRRITLTGPVGLRHFVQTGLHVSDSHMSFALHFRELVPPDMDPDTFQSYQNLLMQLPDIHGSQPFLVSNNKDSFSDHASKDTPQPITGEFVYFDRQLQRYTIQERSESKTNISIYAAPIEHRVFCVGYVFEEGSHPGTLDVSLMYNKFGVKPGQFCSKLKQGQTVQVEHPSTKKLVTISPGDVIGPPKPGRKIVLLGDTCNASGIEHLASDCDFIVHESTLDNSQEERAIDRGHATPRIAAEFAKRIRAKQLVLSHFSARFYRHLPEGEQDMITLDTLQKQAQEIFGENVAIGEDYKTFEIKIRR